MRMTCMGGLWPSSDNSIHDKQNVGAHSVRPCRLSCKLCRGGYHPPEHRCNYMYRECRGGLWPSSDNSTQDKQNVGAHSVRPCWLSCKLCRDGYHPPELRCNYMYRGCRVYLRPPTANLTHYTTRMRAFRVPLSVKL